MASGAQSDRRLTRPDVLALLAGGATWVGQSVLAAFGADIERLFQLALTALLAAVGWPGGRYLAFRDEEEAHEQRAAELDALLACWPPPSIEAANDYDLGVIPSGAGAAAP